MRSVSELYRLAHRYHRALEGGQSLSMVIFMLEALREVKRELTMVQTNDLLDPAIPHLHGECLDAWEPRRIS